MLNMGQGKKKKQAGMNVTPLIDVIFILLIFFMISTQFRQNSLPLDLPRSSGEEKEENKAVTLTVSREEVISLDGQIIVREELESSLYKLKKKNPEVALVLACDRDIVFETVVQILDEVKKSGIEKIGIRHDQMDS